MFYALKGKLIKKDGLTAVIDCLGLQFLVNVPISTAEKLPDVGEDVKLYVELAIGEKSVKLYGFYTLDEKILFNQLRKISKIGAQTALSILSNTSVDEFYKIIEKQDSKALVRIPGIGKKTALSIIVEMAQSLPKKETTLPGKVTDTIETLKNLGFTKKEVSQVVEEIYRKNPSITLEELIKESLRQLRKDVY